MSWLHYPHTPLEIMMIVHYNSVVEPYPGWQYPSQQMAIDSMLQLGLIRPIHVRGNTVCLGKQHGQEGLYGTTELGDQWVQRLRSVPAIAKQ